MENNKFDFAQFDVARLLDVGAALDQIEKSTQSAVNMIPDAKTRDMVTALSEANMELVRLQAAAVKSYAEAVKRAIQV